MRGASPPAAGLVGVLQLDWGNLLREWVGIRALDPSGCSTGLGGDNIIIASEVRKTQGGRTYKCKRRLQNCNAVGKQVTRNALRKGRFLMARSGNGSEKKEREARSNTDPRSRDNMERATVRKTTVR
ncbi:hypothetical protein NDU88_006223 [Pleurodeles waltl]|uniref:Uncharacterized protein n=1 Tax=Pleurodeles waltl TaxID=8319 RepID=A0AAV7LQ86_PLEWA|nr:hypothetical protein NDU88_006223 [Pleurodeles waltl]